MTVPEGNGPIPHVWIRGTLEYLRRIMSEAMGQAFDKHFGQKPEHPEDLRTNDHREASLEQDARQPRLVMEVDESADNEHSRAHRGRRQSSTSDAWGQLFC